MGKECKLLWAHVQVWIQRCNGTFSHRSLAGLDLLWSAHHQDADWHSAVFASCILGG